MVRIIFMNPPASMPSWMADSDGFYSLDLNEKSRIALTRVIDDYIEIGKIKQDTFRDFEAPVTKKNRLLLESIGNPSALNINNGKLFSIQILKGDFTYPSETLQVIGQNDTNFNIQLFGEINKWYRPLSNLYLNEIELGSATVDYTWINARHADNYIYADGLSPVFAPLVNYGEWFIKKNLSANNASSQVVFNNWRFWFSPFAVLEQAFCQIGWKLIAPFMETEWFRRSWMYLLDPSFETANQADIANRPLEVSRTTDAIFTAIFFQYANGNTEGGVVLFPNVITDPGSHFIFRVATAAATDNFFGSFYSGGFIGNFNFSGTVRLNPTSGPLIPVATDFVTLKVSIKKAYKFGVEGQPDFLSTATTLATKTYIYKGILINGVPIDFVFDLNTSTQKFYQHEVVFVHIEYVASMVNGIGQSFNETTLYGDTRLLTGATFKNTVLQQVIEEGDTLDFGIMMRKDLTAIDVFKGVAHLPNFKIETNSISREVSIYPEFKIDLFTDGVQEAYFRDNTDEPFEATEKVQVKSIQQKFRNTNLKREIYLKFQDSTDGFITRQSLEDELHSKKIDLGPDYEDGTNPITNPLIEPLDTAEDEQLGLTFTNYKTVNWIPFMWESEPSEDSVYPQRGFDYAPRIALAYLLANSIKVDPVLTGQDVQTSSSFVYEDSPQTFYNLFGQIFPEGISIQPNPPDPLFEPELAIVYGNGVNPTINDLYELVYSRSINQAYFNLALDFLVLIDLIDFSNLSFRRKWHVKYKSGNWGEIDFYARLSRVQDYLIGGNITTPVELVPDNNNFTNC